MLRSIALPLMVALAAGCGAAPTPAGSTPDPGSTPAESKPAPDAAAGAGAATPAAAAAVATPAAAADKPAGDAATVGRVVATDAPIASKITQDDILALVQKNADLFGRCYTIGAAASKSFRAKVTIKATVSPLGAVNAVEVLSSTAKNPKVDACVSDAFKKLTFTRPAGSGATVFTFPLSFDGMEQVK
jgi:outer membrane biosynthesis protein TonB